jgi:hypothetical protein
MSDRIQFNFDSYVWKNQRKSVRSSGTSGLWYRALNSLLQILVNRSTRLSWLYRQFWLETSDGPGLNAWGIRYRIRRRPGESDNNYKTRIILERLFKLSVPSVSTKIQVISAITGLARSQFEYKSVYKDEVGKDLFRMGSPISLPMMTRKYILHRYRFILPPLPIEFDRASLVEGLNNVNIGGNVPEIWEDAGEFDPFVMGGTLSGKLLSRREERTREVLVY